MPTGYTATLCEKDQPFSEFVLGCARAFGACISQRDDPMSDLPRIEPKSNYHEVELEKAQAELTKLQKLSKAARIKFGEKKKSDSLAYSRKELVKHEEARARLETMLAKVNSWHPPSSDHIELKKFMIQQLTTTIEHDGDTNYYRKQIEADSKKTAMDYYIDAIKSAEWSVEYHLKENKKDSERHDGRSQWISDLFQSLEQEKEMSWLLLSQKSST